MFFINEEAKEIVLGLSQGTVKVFQFSLIQKITQYFTVNVKLSNLQLNNLKTAVKMKF